jgi:EAL domain-containing protein (putative c-di-GMP-specific phosphodiesterase class I)
MEELLKEADIAMYQAKAAGRNTARFYDPEMQAVANAHTQLRRDLEQGLSKGQFALHYQVQVDTQGAVIGVEALVRWNHPLRGMVLPGNFIPVAESMGLILPLGRWVLESACSQLVAWAKNPSAAHWTVAVNVSALQLDAADFVSVVSAVLEQTGANATLLKIEITESMLMSNVDDCIEKMVALKALGVQFALDDFGTGYSSLAYLKRLPLSQLKIDQSFVRDLLIDPNDEVIASAIVALGHSLGLRVVAEGVETEAQSALLAKLGCDAQQGYYFGRPVSVDLVPTGLG